MTTPSVERGGTLLALAAAALFGASAPLARLLVRDVAPLTLSALLYLGAGLGLLVVSRLLAVLQRRAEREAPLVARDTPLLAAIVVMGGVIGPLLFLVGLAHVSGVVGALAINLEAPLTILLAVALFREHLGGRESVAAGLVVAGVVLVGYDSTSTARSHALGVLAIAGGCLAWAVDNNLTQRLSLRDPLAVARVKALASGTLSLALAMALGYRLPGTVITAAALALGFVSYGLSLVCAILAMRRLGAARQATVFASAPFIGAMLAVPILGDRLTPRDVVAALLMAMGIVALTTSSHEHLHTHEAVEHTHRHHHDEHHRHAHAEADPSGEPHSHAHRHVALTHSHAHASDAHHRHRHRWL